MNKFLMFLALIGLGFVFGLVYSKQNNKSNLDKHYFDDLTEVKFRLLTNSSVDSKKSLEDYEDKIELYMHLDGYNSLEILNMKCKAIIEAAKKNKSKSHPDNYGALMVH